MASLFPASRARWATRALRPSSSLLFCLLAALLLSGCGTAPVTYKLRADAESRASSLRAVQAAPLDIAVEEISAGGMREKHDELTTLVRKNITDAVGGTYRIVLPNGIADLDAGATRAEFEEVQALLRAITANDAMPFGLVAQRQGPGPAALTYEVGRIDRIADALGADAVLFIFVRDQYSSGGRKAVMALAMIAGAAAGVAVTPQMGLTASSAALVTRDGTVLWFNNLGAAGLDLRSPANAKNWVTRLLAGLPKLPANTGERLPPPAVPETPAPVTP